MRIAYVCHWNLGAADGVTKKIELQTRRWRTAGHEVTVFALAPGEARDGVGLRSFPYAGTVARAAGSTRLVRAVRAFRPDVVYLRYDLFLPPVWTIPWLLPTVVELNTDDRAEWALRSRAAAAYNELNRRALLVRARGVVAVTHELARRAGAGRRARIETIANGIEFDGARPAHDTDDHVRAVFIGSPKQPWHGVDKLVALARRAPDLHIDVVGETADQLAAQVGEVPPNVEVHGRLDRAAYEHLLERADVGVGTLALHRKNMDEAAPLKVREYLAAGLPVLIAYDDVDLAGVDDWWLMRLPNTEHNVDEAAERIAAFAASVKGRRVPADAVAGLISAEAKESRRLELLAAVARA